MKPLAAVALVAIAALAAASCTKKDSPNESREAGKGAASSVPPRTWPADAPDPNAACNAHSDCSVMSWGAPKPPDPCCDTSVYFWAVHRTYAEWTSRYHKEHCAGVKCKALPLPGPEPTCCMSIGRCVNHKCISGCEDPTLHAPNVVWLENECRMPAPQ